MLFSRFCSKNKIKILIYRLFSNLQSAAAVRQNQPLREVEVVMVTRGNHSQIVQQLDPLSQMSHPQITTRLIHRHRIQPSFPASKLPTATPQQQLIAIVLPRHQRPSKGESHSSHRRALHVP